MIARELGVSPRTVEKHRSNLMRKLQLHNAAAITALINSASLLYTMGCVRPCCSDKRNT